MQLVPSMWMRPRATFIGTAPVLACRPSYLSPLAWLGLQAAALWPHLSLIHISEPTRPY